MEDIKMTKLLKNGKKGIFLLNGVVLLLLAFDKQLWEGIGLNATPCGPDANSPGRWTGHTRCD